MGDPPPWLEGAVEEAGPDRDEPTYRRHLQRLRSNLFGSTEQAVQIDRYIIDQKIGAGGMGTVYRARDPELDRPIALKVIACVGEDAREAALYEARSLAMLSHPNVAQVYDVGVAGPTSAFIAMELVPGRNLSQWLSAEQRGYHAIVEVMRGAGRGLAAAHRAGLVHRDFKPANVVVGEDGVPRVIDFGIAVSGVVLPSTGRDMSRSTRSSASRAGTPGYMSPEQRRGADLDGRSDQYSYCVVFYEALTGARLPKGVAPARGTPPGVPPWLWKIVLRGMDKDPERRFPSMDAVLDALDRRRRGHLVLPAATLGVVVFTVAAATEPEPPIANCADAGVAQIWNDDKRSEMEAAFAQTGVSYADETFELAAANLDAYARRLQAAKEEVCVVSTSASDLAEFSDRATVCLKRRRGRLGALVDRFESPAADTVTKAVAMVGDLDSISVCLDTTQLMARDDLSLRDPEHEAFWEVIDKLQIARGSGDIDGAMTLSRLALERAEQLETADAKVVAQTEYGGTLLAQANYDDAERELEEAYFAAVAEGFERRASLACAHLLAAHDASSDFEDANRWVRHAQNHLDRLGDHPRTASSLATAMGVVLSSLGRNPEALEAYERAAELRSAAGEADSVSMAMILNNQGAVHQLLGRPERGVELARQSLAMRRRLLGPHHPDVLMGVGNLAAQLVMMGEYEESKRLAEEALAIADELGPAGERMRGSAYNTLGNLAFDAGDFSVSVDYYEQALAGRHNDPERAQLTINLARAQEEAGDRQAAAASFDLAIELLERSYDADHPYLRGARLAREDFLARGLDKDW